MTFYENICIDKCRNLPWGAWSLTSLVISVVSGIIVGMQYDPAEPYYSAASLDLLVPFGKYFRSLHFYSSQLFFLTGIIHLVVVFDRTESYRRTTWIRLVATLPVAMILLFTGYILRGDTTGSSAGMIAESILLTIPLAGTLLNKLLFSVTEHGMQRVYLHHIITFDVLWLILAWEHLRRYRVRFANHLLLVCIVCSFSLFVAAPLEPDRLGTTYITGPWFFLGLQELLRYFPPLIAGLITPLLLVAALCYLRPTVRLSRSLLLFIAVWLTGYALLTTIALLR